MKIYGKTYIREQGNADEKGQERCLEGGEIINVWSFPKKRKKKKKKKKEADKQFL